MKIGPIDIKSTAPQAVGDRKAGTGPVAATEPSAKVELSSQAALAGSGLFEFIARSGVPISKHCRIITSRATWNTPTASI